MGVVERLLNDFLEDTEFLYTVGNSEGRGFGGGRGDIGNIDIDNGELPDIGDFSKPDDGQLPSPARENLCNMTKNMQARCVQSAKRTL